MQLSKKLKIFCEVFTALAKYMFNFEHLELKDECQGLFLSKVIDCEIRAYVTH